MRKKQEEKAEQAEKEEASHSKNEATKDMVSRWSDGARGAPMMSVVGGSSAPRPPALSLNFRCLFFILFICN
jgi:hypothetical protein